MQIFISTYMVQLFNLFCLLTNQFLEESFKRKTRSFTQNYLLN